MENTINKNENENEQEEQQNTEQKNGENELEQNTNKIERKEEEQREKEETQKIEERETETGKKEPETWEINIEKYEEYPSTLTKLLPLQRKQLQTIQIKYNPIIYKTFNDLKEICENNFNFISQRLPFEQYMEFYKEVNRIKPKLEKKITESIDTSKIYYVGDTHGSIEDSFTMIEFFEKAFEIDPEIKVVFVGDYVDRNPWDLQNLTLIVAFYFLYPKNVILLRGNHEDRIINQYYGFMDNLLRFFREDGEILYDEIIQFFTHLPVAHINHLPHENGMARVFTVHGGIPIDPRNFMTPLDLKEIEKDLRLEVETSDEMDPYTVSMLWADPDEQINTIVTDDQGTGRLRFGITVLNAFMKKNNIQLIVRGHQKWKAGYRIFFGGRLYSLFSTSKYDDRKKFDPKIMELQVGKINILEIDERRLNERIKELEEETKTLQQN